MKKPARFACVLTAALLCTVSYSEYLTDDEQQQLLCGFVFLDGQPLVEADIFCVPDAPLDRIVSYQIQTDSKGYFEVRPKEQFPTWRVIIRNAEGAGIADARSDELDSTQHALLVQAKPNQLTATPRQIGGGKLRPMPGRLPVAYTSAAETPLRIQTTNEAVVATEFLLSSGTFHQVAEREKRQQHQ